MVAKKELVKAKMTRANFEIANIKSEVKTKKENVENKLKVTKILSNFKILGQKKIIDDSLRIGDIMTGYVNIAFDNLKKLMEILKPHFPVDYKNDWYEVAFSTEILNELRKNL